MRRLIAALARWRARRRLRSKAAREARALRRLRMRLLALGIAATTDSAGRR